eukprot:505511-Amphidinium_carterae.1
MLQKLLTIGNCLNAGDKNLGCADVAVEHLPGMLGLRSSVYPLCKFGSDECLLLVLKLLDLSVPEPAETWEVWSSTYYMQRCFSEQLHLRTKHKAKVATIDWRATTFELVFEDLQDAKDIGEW